MTEYPTGVYQNDAPPNAPVNFIAIAEANWTWFSNQEDADRGYGMIDALCDKASMVDAETLGGEYTQYFYTKPAQALGIHCRVVNATAQDEDGRMKICEYPSAIVDRDSVPNPFIDKYSPGQAHVLKVQRLTSDLGQLFWDAA
jgi:hypothetical protein